MICVPGSALVGTYLIFIPHREVALLPGKKLVCMRTGARVGVLLLGLYLIIKGFSCATLQVLAYFG